MKRRTGRLRPSKREKGEGRRGKGEGGREKGM